MLFRSRILYGLLNGEPDTLVERVFAPWPDMEAAMRARDIPLFTLESWRPVRDFDLLGFSLQYELTYTNLLCLLDLAGIPLRSAEREEIPCPLVIAGGPGAFNPEPLAEFIDLFFLGEAEEGLPEIVDTIRRGRRQGLKRAALLRSLSSLAGVYIPSLFTVEYRDDEIGRASWRVRV